MDGFAVRGICCSGGQEWEVVSFTMLWTFIATEALLSVASIGNLNLMRCLNCEFKTFKD
jgi:hypothetical protein